jgi:hypothetical protein
MLRTFIFAAGALCLAGAAWSQAVLGTVSNITGIVTTTVGNTGGIATEGSSILDGTRFVTGAGGSATLILANGCVVELKANQAVTVVAATTCTQLLAGVGPAFGGTVIGGVTGNRVLASVLVGAGLMALIKSDKVSGD